MSREARAAGCTNPTPYVVGDRMSYTNTVKLKLAVLWHILVEVFGHPSRDGEVRVIEKTGGGWTVEHRGMLRRKEE